MESMSEESDPVYKEREGLIDQERREENNKSQEYISVIDTNQRGTVAKQIEIYAEWVSHDPTCDSIFNYILEREDIEMRHHEHLVEHIEMTRHVDFKQSKESKDLKTVKHSPDT